MNTGCSWSPKCRQGWSAAGKGDGWYPRREQTCKNVKKPEKPKSFGEENKTEIKHDINNKDDYSIELKSKSESKKSSFRKNRTRDENNIEQDEDENSAANDTFEKKRSGVIRLDNFGKNSSSKKKSLNNSKEKELSFEHKNKLTISVKSKSKEISDLQL